jgi:copper chaperone CopZ
MTTTATYRVTGMTCDHCVRAVTDEMSAIPGVRDVEVELVAGGESTVRVVSEDALSDDTVREAVDEAGYELTGGTP